MPRGSKAAYSDKQKRKARHIEEGYEDKGVSHEEAERRAWATVNKQDGGGKISGSGRGKTRKATAKKRTASRKNPGSKPKKPTTKKRGK